MVQPQNEMLFSNKKKRTVDICKNMNEFQLPSTKCNTSLKDYILYNSINMIFLKRENYRDKEKISSCPALGLEGEIYYKEAQGNFFHWMNVFRILRPMVITQLYALSKLTELYTTWVNFTVGKLRFSNPDLKKKNTK